MSFIVVFDDEQGLCVPFTWDGECEGAICCGDMQQGVAQFETQADARRAIRISAAFARLRKAQGLPENTDFTEGRKQLRIVPLKPR